MKAALIPALAGPAAAAICDIDGEAVPATKNCTRITKAIIAAQEEDDSDIPTDRGCTSLGCLDHCEVNVCSENGATFTNGDLIADVNGILKECGSDAEKPFKGQSPEVDGQTVKIADPGEKCDDRGANPGVP